MELEFQNKVVIITTASSGIGTPLAIKFTQLGADLVLIGPNAKHLEAVEKLCTLYSSKKPLTIIADLTQDKEVEALIETIIMHYQKIDILINNSGIVENGSILDTDVNQYDRVFKMNVRSIYHLTNLCVPYLMASKGSIVNISCVCGLRAYAGVLAYCMSKCAIDQFTKCVALELAPKGVRVNCVNSGDIFKRTNPQSGDGRDGDEITEVVVFLASDKASFITGACVPVDGGTHIM